MELSKRRNAPHITHTENNKTALLSVSSFFSSAATNRVFIKLHEGVVGCGQNNLEFLIR